MKKYYINGKEVKERQFKIAFYLFDELTHYAMIDGKYTYEWGRIPKLIIKRKNKNE